MTEDITNPSTSSSDTKSKLKSAIKDLRQLLMKETDNFKAKSLDNLSQGHQGGRQVRQELKTQLERTFTDLEQYNISQLESLKESLEGQLESLGGYTDQLVTTEESNLVNSLETTLTNVKDVSNAQNEGLQELFSKVTKISEKALEGSMKISEERNSGVREEMETELRASKEVLVSDITGLQDQFRDEINTKIENVFMGVSNTKRMIDGIISDTLSRLQENLNRLTEGIDSNFTIEVGQTQDMIHNYEGKLIEAIEKSQVTFEKQIEVMLQKHADLTSNSLNTLKQELDTFKASIIDDIVMLNSSQAQLFANATQQLDQQIQRSRAEVIDSHGTLKDELEKLLVANKEGISEALENMKEEAARKKKSLEKEVEERISEANSQYDLMQNRGKNITEESVENLRNHIKQGTSRSENIISDK